MNRNDQYDALLRELEHTPPELEGTIQRAAVRARKRRRRWIAVPSAAAAVFAAFVVAVNTSVSFAYAMAEVPVLGDLAALVETSDYVKDLRDAIKHHQAQVVGQRQTVDGLSVTVEYAIADPWQVDLFLRTENEDGGLPYTKLELLCPESDYVFEFREDENGWLRRFVLSFPDGSIPGELPVQVLAWPGTSVDGEGDGDPIVFDFTVTIEEEAISPVRTVEIGRWLAAGDQRLWLDRLEITRSGTWLVMDGAEENSAWMTGIQVWQLDENGERVNAGFWRGSDETGEYALGLGESAWDSDGQIQFVVNYSWWQSKDTAAAVIDTETKTAEGLPEWLTLEDIYVKANAVSAYYPGRPVYYKDATVLVFSCPTEKLEKRVEKVPAYPSPMSPFMEGMNTGYEEGSTYYFEIHCVQGSGGDRYTYEGNLITLKLGSQKSFDHTDLEPFRSVLP